MLKIENINAGYDTKQVLFDISFSLPDNENMSIIGPNGCGKTTLLRVIANIIPFTGNVLLDNEPTKNFKRKEMAKKVALLSQITQINFSYTVFDTVMMGRYAHIKKGLFSNTSSIDTEITEKALKAVHMLEHRDRDINTLSGGQLQRVFLAKILAQEPEIILLDEPTNHLDLSYQIELIEFLKVWSKENNISVIGVLHDINLAMELSNKILLLNHGKVVHFGSAKETLTKDILEEVYQMDVKGYMLNMLKAWEETS